MSTSKRRLATSYLIFLTLVTDMQGTEYTLHGIPPSISDKDWNEVKNLTSKIKDTTLRFIMQNQLIYCPHLSACSSSYHRHYRPRHQSCCQQCSCSGSCFDHGSCCPFRLISNISHAPGDDEMSCDVPELGNFAISFIHSKQAYFMKTKCGSNQCKKFSSTSSNFMIPVTSVASHKTYISTECALCNNETEENILPWTGELDCYTSPGLLTFQNLKDVILNKGICNLMFTPPTGVNTNKCPWGIITQCNVTGRWQSYDARIEYGCSAFTSTYMEIYRNVFCYMCNEQGSPSSECLISGGRKIKYPTSFSILLDFRSVSKKDEHRQLKTDTGCSVDKKYDAFLNTCHHITCSSNLIYDPSTFTCKQPFTLMQAMRYKVYIKFVPLFNFQEKCSHCPDDLCLQFKNHILYDFSYKHNMFSSRFRCSLRLFYKTGNTGTCSKDVVRYFIILIEQGLPQRHNFREVISDDILSLGGSVEEVYTSKGSVMFEVFVVGVDDIPSLKENDIWFDPADDGYLYELYAEMPEEEDFIDFCRYSLMTNVSYTTLCPRIKLKSTYLDLNASISVLTVKYLNVSLTAGEYQSDGENHYLVCAEKYFKRMSNLTIKKMPRILNESLGDEFDVDLLERIFSLVCTVLSVLSLLITVFTYFIFSQLRTIPGKNTLGLCITLLMAHLLYPFAYMLNTYHAICVAAGIGIHFLWLCSLFWMNVCCIHMFRVFRSVDNMLTAAGNDRYFIIYIAFVFFGPIVFIVINIGVSLHTNGTIGYGGPQCYITSREMVLYTFALPIACIILVNIVLFLIVVFKLQTAGSVDMANKTQRNNFKIYAKLSSLTGMTWILGFLYQWLLFKPLAFAFILFAAGQGVFIMISFVCNSRIKSLYSRRFTLKKMSTT